jgi:hypothetical protein
MIASTTINGKTCLFSQQDLELIIQHQWLYHSKLGFYTNSGKTNRKVIYLHRLILNAPKGMVVDHINNNHCDNRRENLRICTQSQNSKNQKKPKNNTSGYKGVVLDIWAVKQKLKKQWLAQIKVNRKKLNLGRFLTKEEAKEAYDKAALKYFGVFAKIND